MRRSRPIVPVVAVVLLAFLCLGAHCDFRRATVQDLSLVVRDETDLFVDVRIATREAEHFTRNLYAVLDEQVAFRGVPTEEPSAPPVPTDAELRVLRERLQLDRCSGRPVRTEYDATVSLSVDGAFRLVALTQMKSVDGARCVEIETILGRRGPDGFGVVGRHRWDSSIEGAAYSGVVVAARPDGSGWLLAPASVAGTGDRFRTNVLRIEPSGSLQPITTLSGAARGAVAVGDGVLLHLDYVSPEARQGRIVLVGPGGGRGFDRHLDGTYHVAIVGEARDQAVVAFAKQFESEVRVVRLTSEGETLLHAIIDL